MSRLRSTTLILILVLVAATALAGDPGTWFDLENCGMCKNLLVDQELFQAMTWETHVLTNGLLEVTTYPDGYAERHDALMASMEAAGQKMMAGESMPMCNMCMSYGGMMMAGADMDHVTTESGMVTVITSQDPKVVAMIKDHADTTIKAYDMMIAGAESGNDHGHQH